MAIDAVINIARRNRIDAIHPGYGFLSENSDFAKACEDNGIIFIGPRYQTIIRMGDKIAAKKVANECQVPVVPGTIDPVDDKEAAY